MCVVVSWGVWGLLLGGCLSVGLGGLGLAHHTHTHLNTPHHRVCGPFNPIHATPHKIPCGETDLRDIEVGLDLHHNPRSSPCTQPKSNA
jgi:hypothetical protein